MINKREQRLRRAKSTRMKLRELRVPRLSVFRSASHIYAQVISEDGSRIICSSSTLLKEMRAKKLKGNIKGAEVIGKDIAAKAKKNKIDQVGFDRSGFKFHGCIKALADAARKEGLKL